MITDIKNHQDHITKEPGVTFTIHDLRRTFITIAEGLDILAYAVKRLVNHKINNDAATLKRIAKELE